MPCTCPFYCFPTLQYFVLLVFVSLYCSCTVYCVLHLQCIFVLLYIQYLPVLPLSKHFYAPIYFTYRSSSPIFRSSLYNVHYLAAKPCVLHICRGFLNCTSVTCLWSPNLPSSRLRKFALFSIKLFAILLFLGVSDIDLRIFATCFPRDCAKNKASAHIWWQVYWSL